MLWFFLLYTIIHLFIMQWKKFDNRNSWEKFVTAIAFIFIFSLMAHAAGFSV